MNRDALEKIADAIAEECIEDYVGLWVLLKETSRAFPEASASELQDMTLEVVRELLNRGSVVAGDLSSEDRFCNWRLSTDHTVARVHEEWERLGHEPNIADIVWFTAP